MEGMNTRNSIDEFHVVVFPPIRDLTKFLETVPKAARSAGMTVELGYTHLAEKSQKGQGIH